VRLISATMCAFVTCIGLSTRFEGLAGCGGLILLHLA
jgi:hypothetical protein